MTQLTLSLREADQLQHELQQWLDSAMHGVNMVVRITEDDVAEMNVAEKIGVGTDLVNSKVLKALGVIDLLYAIRGRLAVANATSGVSASLAEMNQLSKTAVFINSISTTGVPALAPNVVVDRIVRSQAAASAIAPTRAEVVVGTMSPGLRQQLDDILADNKLKMRRVKNQLATLNAKHTITLDEGHAQLLRDLHLIE